MRIQINAYQDQENILEDHLNFNTKGEKMKKLKYTVTACQHCGKRRRKKEDDSEYCPAIYKLVPTARTGTYFYGGHLWIRTRDRIL